MIERSLQVRKGDVGPNGQPLNLMEDGRMRGVGGVVTVHLAGDHNAQGRRLLNHGADLHGRRVGAHQQAVAAGLMCLSRHLQGVLRIARRVVFRKVKRLKIVEIAFDLRAEPGRIAELVKDFDDAVHGLEQRVRDAGRAHGTGQRDIQARRHGPGRRRRG